MRWINFALQQMRRAAKRMARMNLFARNEGGKLPRGYDEPKQRAAQVGACWRTKRYGEQHATHWNRVSGVPGLGWLGRVDAGDGRFAVGEGLRKRELPPSVPVSYTHLTLPTN